MKQISAVRILYSKSDLYDGYELSSPYFQPPTVTILTVGAMRGGSKIVHWTILARAYCLEVRGTFFQLDEFYPTPLLFQGKGVTMVIPKKYSKR